MWELLDFGYDILGMIDHVMDWIVSKVDANVIRFFNLTLGWTGLELQVGVTYAELLFGAGLIFVLIWRLIKFLLPNT